MSQQYLGDRKFHASIDAASVGCLDFTRFSLCELRAETTQQTIRQQGNNPDQLFMSLVLSGTVRSEQHGRAIKDSAGTFSIRDPSTPWIIEHKGPSDVLAIAVPRARLESVLGSARRFTGLTVNSTLPTTALAKSFLRDLLRVENQLTPQAAERMSSVAIDLIATSIADQMAMDTPKPRAHCILDACDATSIRDEPTTIAVREAMLIHAHRLIEQNLHRPDLTPTRAAALLGISVRTLHFVFEPTGVSFSRYVLGQRLSRADRLLREMPHRSVTEVAYTSGFHSLSTFFRCYRKAYNTSPSEWRADAGRTGNRSGVST